MDWGVLLCYLVCMLGMGWYFSRRQDNTAEYFTGGGNMNPVLVGISYFATLLSTVSYLAGPGEIIKHGPVAVIVGIIAFPLIYIVVGYWLLPTLMKHRLTSAYELLEEKLGTGIRLLAAVMFIALRLIWMGLLLYVASQALVVVMGLEDDAAPMAAAVAGMIAVIYTSIGGMRTVVITDLAQSILLLGGTFLAVAIISISDVGLSWIPTSWSPNWDTQPLFSFDPHVRITVFGTVLHSFTWSVCTAGSDQTTVQRFMSTRDASAARRSFLVSLIVQTLVAFFITILGFALLGYYTTFPELLSEGISPTEDADRIFPFFIAHNLPTVAAGLVVAAVFAAAMSSIDSGTNSITAVVLTDFLDRFNLRPKSEKAHSRMAMALALGIGIISVTFSTFMDKVPGNFTALAYKTGNLLVAPISSLFFLVLFVRFATPLGAYTGVLCGTVVAVLISFWDVFTGQPAVSFQYIIASSLLSSIGVGCLVSYLGPKRGQKWNKVIGVVMTVVILACSLAAIKIAAVD